MSVTSMKEDIKYKVINEKGEELAIENSNMLAEMFISKLPEDVKRGAKIIPVTEGNQQVLFG